jgi:uncharacterized protein
MVEPAFDEERLMIALLKLESRKRIVFGAACCERMLHNYQRFMEDARWGDFDSLRLAVDAIWRRGGGQLTEPFELRGFLAKCEEGAPHSENFDSLYTTLAQDAVFAVCNAIDFLLGEEIESIVSVGRYSTDSVDFFVQEQEAMLSQDPDLEDKILKHPLMQQELLRQKRDLEELQSLDISDSGALLGFRTRAQDEHILILSS